MLFRRPRKPQEAAKLAEERVDEILARTYLYGSQNRSGQVEVCPLDEPVNPLWMDWDSISWEDPRPKSFSGKVNA